MSQTSKVTVETPARLDAFLAASFPEYSRSKLQRLIEAGHVRVNGTQATLSKQMVQPGQTIEFNTPEAIEFPLPSTRPVDIIYEDDDLLVVDKPIGMVTHPTVVTESESLVQSLMHHYPKLIEALYDPASEVSRLRPGIVHRLDKDTSGLLVVAKNRQTLLALSEQFHQRTVEKVYETILYGALKEETRVDAPIHRKGNTKDNLMVASHTAGDGRPAVTTFTPVEVYAPHTAWPQELATRVSVKLETGRTHQIRVHAKFIGHPVLGDQRYTNKPASKLSERLGLTGQQLRAVKLSFTHPKSGERLTFALS